MFGGGVCAVTCLNLSPSLKDTNDPAITHISGEDSSSESSVTGNCLINSGADENSAFFRSLSISHISFSCVGNEHDDSKIKANWRVWIPVKLVKSPRTLLSERKKISIKAQTSDLGQDADDIYVSKTTFESFVFNSPITGKWGELSFVVSDLIDEQVEDKVYRVKILEENDDPIFLRLK